MTELLKQCVEAFKRARTGLFQGAALLYEIREKGAFAGSFESFSEFVEEGCGLSRGYASKLLSAYEHYALEGGVSPAKLAEVDHEKLYMAMSLKGSPEQQLVKAQKLTRGELKAEQRDIKPCSEHEPITICAKCHARLDEN